jgi:hypothetical protein
VENKKILMFSLKGEKKKAVAALTRELGFEPVICLRGQLSERLAVIAGNTLIPPTGRQYFGEGLPSEMLVFSGLTDSELDKFLKLFKERQLPQIEHKAVITPTNSMWTPVELFEELEKERKKLN